MAQPRGSGRQKIIEAANELALETGPGNLSLDAVAARAGVSKGGLLYHFPSKTMLLKAMVSGFVDEFARALDEREAENPTSPAPLLAAYLDLFVEQQSRHRPPPAGILAALAEDPGFVEPVRQFERSLLDRMRREGGDPAVALIAYLVIHGIRTMDLLSLDIVSDGEVDMVLSRLREMIDGQDQVSGGTVSAERLSRRTM